MFVLRSRTNGERRRKKLSESKRVKFYEGDERLVIKVKSR